MDIKALIFDLDGVVVDTAKYHYLAWKKLADELGFFFSEKDNERLKGVSRVRSLEILLEVGGVQLEEDVKKKLAAKKNEDYLAYIKKMTPDEILPGVINFLEEARIRGLKTAIGSASKNAVTILETVQLLDYFDEIIDGNEVSKAKPDPEVFLNAARKLGVKTQECIVFEDAEAGIEAAINGAFHVVGIGDKNTLNKAEMVIPGFAEVSLDTFLKLGK
ncbi:MAG: beta-phosphoglucomutase [Bacteroidales bacterium]|nr:beta-phosphoglucomutase [Bacteroidales bacterium]